jgi:hypothetical protein
LAEFGAELDLERCGGKQVQVAARVASGVWFFVRLMVGVRCGLLLVGFSCRFLLDGLKKIRSWFAGR